jgi:hypothetical protein
VTGERESLPVGCVERSFVAMLLRTDSLIGNLVNNKTPTPLFFVSADSKGVADAFFVSADSKRVITPVFATLPRGVP